VFSHSLLRRDWQWCLHGLHHILTSFFGWDSWKIKQTIT